MLEKIGARLSRLSRAQLMIDRQRRSGPKPSNRFHARGDITSPGIARLRELHADNGCRGPARLWLGRSRGPCRARIHRAGRLTRARRQRRRLDWSVAGVQGRGPRRAFSLSTPERAAAERAAAAVTPVVAADDEEIEEVDAWMTTTPASTPANANVIRGRLARCAPPRSYWARSIRCWTSIMSG